MDPVNIVKIKIPFSTICLMESFLLLLYPIAALILSGLKHYFACFEAILAQVSLRVTVLLKTRFSGRLSLLSTQK